MRNKRRKQVESQKRKRRTVLFTMGILIVFYLLFTLIFGESGVLKYKKLREVKTNLQADIKGINKENKELKKQIDALEKDPNVVEELAREQGLTREGELVFKFENQNEN